mmetsp:Transcript_16396/g.49457  ORF Transcript_16396/g.49457 Transcript_16396/m.49457 type:complete len:486 (-) Transcript_16396:33-1490(-)
MISLLLACSARIALVDPPDSRSSRLPAPDGDLAVRPARRLTLLRGGGADGWEQIGARPVSIDEERVFAGRAFPMTLSPLLSGRTTLTEWAAEHRETLLQLVRENGAVLLRGFGGMETPQGFSDFVMGLRLEEFGMGCSAAPRTEVAPGVFTANEAPQREETHVCTLRRARLTPAAVRTGAAAGEDPLPPRDGAVRGQARLPLLLLRVSRPDRRSHPNHPLQRRRDPPARGAPRGRPAARGPRHPVRAHAARARRPSLADRKVVADVLQHRHAPGRRGGDGGGRHDVALAREWRPVHRDEADARSRRGRAVGQGDVLQRGDRGHHRLGGRAQRPAQGDPVRRRRGARRRGCGRAARDGGVDGGPPRRLWVAERRRAHHRQPGGDALARDLHAAPPHPRLPVGRGAPPPRGKGRARATVLTLGHGSYGEGAHCGNILWPPFSSWVARGAPGASFGVRRSALSVDKCARVQFVIDLGANDFLRWDSSV